jgi:DNA polymerase I-like protein with 3'-5' exonuclease and polymerase domains
MMKFSDAAYGISPEQFLNPHFIDTPEAYKRMMKDLWTHKMLIVDSETVGDEAYPLFLQQVELETQMYNLYVSDPDQIKVGAGVLSEAKRLLKEYEAFIKETYQVKSVTLGILDPAHRTIITDRRKAVKTAEKEYPNLLAYNKMQDQWEKLQKKIDADESGLMFHRNRLGLVQVGTFDACQYLIDPEVLQDDFKELLRSRVAVIGMNLKFDMIQFAHHLGIFFDDVPVICYDIMLGAKMVKSGLIRRFNLKELSLEFLGYEQSKEEQLSFWLRRPLLPEQVKYSALDVITPGLIFNILKKEIREKGLTEVTELQMSFLKVLTETELTGLYVDLNKTELLKQEIEEKVNDRRAALAEALGDEVWYNPEKEKMEMKANCDFNSPKQTLAQLKLYGRKHGIPELTTLESTSVDAFEEIETHIQILEDISEFRSLLHTRANYCEAITNFHVDSRIHSNFTQLQKEGTRMGSSKPNVQNITQPGEWDKSKYPTFQEAIDAEWTPGQKLRTLFVAAPGTKLYDADYGAIELCMIAYYSQDPMMLASLYDGVDLHALTANRIFSLGYTYDDLKDKAKIKEFKIKYKRERQIAKTFNFAVVYGAGPGKLLHQLRTEANIYDLTEEEIRTMKNEWYALYAGVQTWQNNTLHVAKHYGYCTTRLGREIFFEDPAKVYSKAFNTPIQASCYEGLQQAGVIFKRKVKALEDQGIIRKGAIKIVNFVHDEKMVQADENIAEASVKKLIVDSMIEGMAPLMAAYDDGERRYEAVPVSVDCERILMWAEK